jgi:hypothetical protein
MNRSLTVPAVCCLAAFAAVLAALHGATGRETTRQTSQGREYLAAASRTERATTPIAAQADLLSSDQAKQALTALTGQYVRPWRERQNSPYRMFSRAAPRPIPSISAEIQLADSGSHSDKFLLASIVVTKANQSQPTPCVVDRATGQVRLFAGGRWLAANEWLATAPMP